MLKRVKRPVYRTPALLVGEGAGDNWHPFRVHGQSCQTPRLIVPVTLPARNNLAETPRQNVARHTNLLLISCCADTQGEPVLIREEDVPPPAVRESGQPYPGGAEQGELGL